MRATLFFAARGCLLAAVGLLGACATTTQFSGYVSATDEDAAAVAAGEYRPRALAQVAIVQNPDFNGGVISPKALKKIEQYSMACQRQVDAQLAGPGQSAIIGGTEFGVAGTGTGVAARAAFGSAVSAGKYATYGGIAYILPGAVNGLVTGSYAMASAKGTCTRDFWEDIVHTDPAFRGTHVVVVYAGKAVGNARPPALDSSQRWRR